MQNNDKIGIYDNRRNNWFRVDNAVIKHFAKDIGPLPFLVYSSLAMYANRAGVAWPSYNTLAELTGVSRRSVIDAVNRLVETGLISKPQSTTKGNIYRLEDVNELVQSLHQPQPASADISPTSAESALVLVQNRLEKNKTHLNNIYNKSEQPEINNLEEELQEPQTTESPAGAAIRKMGAKEYYRQLRIKKAEMSDLEALQPTQKPETQNLASTPPNTQPAARIEATQAVLLPDYSDSPTLRLNDRTAVGAAV